MFRRLFLVNIYPTFGGIALLFNCKTKGCKDETYYK